MDTSTSHQGFAAQRPPPEFRFSEDVERQLERMAAHVEFWKDFFGNLTFRSSTWSQLAESLVQREEELCALLNQKLDPFGYCSNRVVGASLVCIQGQKGDYCADSWMNLLGLIAKFDLQYDYTGTGTDTAKRGRKCKRTPQCLPTLASLGMQESLDIQSEGGGYVLRVSELYNMRKWTGYDALGWMGELVVLRIRVAPLDIQVLLVVPADASSEQLDLKSFTVTSLSGDEVVCLQLDISQTRGEDFLRAVSEKIGRELREIRLVFPSGQCCDNLTGRDATLDELLQSDEAHQ